MNVSIPIYCTVANPAVMRSLTGGSPPPPPSGGGIQRRLRAVWSEGGVDVDLGTLAGFGGGTSFSGSHGSIVLPRPSEKNARTLGDWWQVLTPNDLARIKIFQIVPAEGIDIEVPLLMGVPAPDGITESYGRRETIEIRFEDVTGAAQRITNFTIPYSAAETVDPLWVTQSVIPQSPVVTSPGIPVLNLYALQDVPNCFSRFPNALMLADDVLMHQQDTQNPLAGLKRIRYGNRDGGIIYRTVEDPALGAPFNTAANVFGGSYDFEYTGLMLTAFAVEPRYIRFSVPRLNPYIDLGSRVRLRHPRAGIDEVVEIQDIQWQIGPRDERLTLRGRREYTL